MATHLHRALVLRRPRSPSGVRAFLARRWWVAAVGLLAAVLIVGLLAIFGSDGERQALLRMEPEHRRALYERTRLSTETLCVQATTDESLWDRCIEAAQFLREFPECDAACVEFARHHQKWPTR